MKRKQMEIEILICAHKVFELKQIKPLQLWNYFLWKLNLWEYGVE